MTHQLFYLPELRQMCW